MAASSQGVLTSSRARLSFLATFVALMAVVAAAGGFLRRGTLSTHLLLVATTGLFGVGLIGIFSIGLPLLIAAGISAVAVIGSMESENGSSPRYSATALAASAAAPLAVLAVGLTLTPQ